MHGAEAGAGLAGATDGALSAWVSAAFFAGAIICGAIMPTDKFDVSRYRQYGAVLLFSSSLLFCAVLDAQAMRAVFVSGAERSAHSPAPVSPHGRALKRYHRCRMLLRMIDRMRRPTHLPLAPCDTALFDLFSHDDDAHHHRHTTTAATAHSRAGRVPRGATTTVRRPRRDRDAAAARGSGDGRTERHGHNRHDVHRAHDAPDGRRDRHRPVLSRGVVCVACARVDGSLSLLPRSFTNSRTRTNPPPILPHAAF